MVKGFHQCKVSAPMHRCFGGQEEITLTLVLTSLYLLPNRQDSPILFCILQHALAVMDMCILKLPPCFWGYLVVWSALERLCFYKADWRYLRKLKTRHCFGPFKSSSYITETKLFPFSKAILAVWALHPQFRLYGLTLSAEILSWLWALSSHSIRPPPLGSAEQFLHPSPESTKGEEAFRAQLHWGSSHLHPRQDSSQIPFSGVSLVSWCLTPGLHEFSKIHLFL